MSCGADGLVHHRRRLEKDAVERRLKSASFCLPDGEPETDLGLRRAMDFDLTPAALSEHGPDRARGQLRRVAIAAQMAEHDPLQFSTEQLLDDGGGGRVRQMPV